MYLEENPSLFKSSRRSFLKGLTAVSATAALYGCGSSADTEYVTVPSDSGGGDSESEVELTYAYGSSTHNCGGRCVSKAYSSNGRVVRIMNYEEDVTGAGEYINPNSRNVPQTRPCSRCRSYRYRLNHPGRLCYPLKQTKKRGDLTGFERITWEQALYEIVTKHKVVTDTYGLDGIYVLYDSAANAGVQGRDACEVAYRFMGYVDGVGEAGGHWKDQFGTYSTHQNSYIGTGYTGVNSQTSANDVANNSNTLVMFGYNSCTTANNNANSMVQVAKDMKKRGGKVYWIGPEFSDTGIVMADEWFASKPFTDPALIAGMVYHMLDNTFDLATGAIKSNPWLDIDWLDTMVYGFFDSPAYNLTEATGVIAAQSGPAAAGTRNVDSVPAGRSYCSWVLGNNNAAQVYSPTGTNYTARQFNGIDGSFKRWAACSYTATKGAATEYKTKKDFSVPKTPAWASAITGVPEDAIKELAQRFIFNAPVTCGWSGGMQKQADGCINLLAIQALQVITKNVAEYGASYVTYSGFGPSLQDVPGALTAMTNASISKNAPSSPQRPTMSCTAWHTAIKSAFAEEMYGNGYRAQFIPNWPTDSSGNRVFSKGVAYWDDGGTKAAVIKWKRTRKNDKNGVNRMMVDTYQDENGNEFYDWEGRTGVSGTATAHQGTPVYAGIRLLYNSSSNIIINQHENSNDSMEMMQYLNLNQYDDPDTFCLVTFDNFMSPTTRWSDYVLPTTTAYEHSNVLAASATMPFFIPRVQTPPGESKAAWELCKEFLTVYERVQTNAKTHASNVGVAASYAGGSINNTIEGLARKNYFDNCYSNGNSPFFGKTWEEYLKNPVLVKKPDETSVVSPTGYATKQAYNKLSTAQKLNPFIKTGTTVTTNAVDKGGYNGGTTNAENYGDLFVAPANCPKPSLRYHVFSGVLTWQYEHLFDKWHGFLPEAQRGQQHKDFEGDRLVYEIPLYYAYQDYFMEAYGNSMAKVEQLPLLLTTTHDKYRSHSSMAENPLLRELTCRVPGKDENGKPIQGNDFGDYAMGPTQNYDKTGTFPYLSRAIEADGSVKPENKDIASYAVIWMNDVDGANMGISDGDLVQAENPVGAVRCVARLSKRCVRGYAGLHQGLWYDPRAIANGGGGIYNHPVIDVGGNVNTLMASQPSRIDHGNGQQSGMVRIFKVEQ